MPRIIKVPKSPYKFQMGNFGVIVAERGLRPVTNWYTCREIFHSYIDLTFNKKGKCVASHKPKQIILFATLSCDNFEEECQNRQNRHIKAFIRCAEKILKLKSTERCTFIRTNHRNVLAIELGKFWCERVCSNLFTILLRAAQRFHKYRGDDFWAVCRHEPYLKETWDAFEAFMSGQTKVTNRFYANKFLGWVCDFVNHRFRDKCSTNFDLCFPKKRAKS
jgi:hypothetical protein